jgi:outer membrane protein
MTNGAARKSSVAISLACLAPAFVLWCGLSQLAFAQLTPAVPCESQIVSLPEIALAQAVDLSLCKNTEIQSAAATVRVRAAQLGQQRSQYWPSLSGSATELREITQFPGTHSAETRDTATTVYGALTWRLFDFGGRRASVHAASELLEAAFASQNAAVQKVLATVVQAYFDAVTAKALMIAREEDQGLAQQTLNSANHRLERGDGAQGDALQARGALARAELELTRARASYHKALAVLAYSIGAPIGTAFEVPTEAETSSTPEMQATLATWLEAARRSHPAISAARADLEAASAQVIAARSSGRPTIDFQGNYYANGFPQQGLAANRQRSETLGITISIPVFDGFLTRYRVHEAQATVRLKEVALLEAERVTLTDVVNAYEDATAALDGLTPARDLLEAATAAHASSERRYEAGATDIVELLTTQETLSNARQENIRSSADWRSSRLRLLAATSLLTVDAVTHD